MCFDIDRQVSHISARSPHAFVGKSTYVTRAYLFLLKISRLSFPNFLVTNKYLARTFQRPRKKTNAQRASSAFSARMSSIEKKKENPTRSTNSYSFFPSYYSFPFISIRLSDIATLVDGEGRAQVKYQFKCSNIARGEEHRTRQIEKEKLMGSDEVYKDGRGTWQSAGGSAW